MGYPDTFRGFCVDSPKTWNKFHQLDLKPKPFGDHDIDVEIDACGVCGSDVHTVTGGWGEFPGPLCVGHEVVGRAVRVGPHVRSIKKGDRVGVGAQVSSCLECDLCKNENENYCQGKVDTYEPLSRFVSVACKLIEFIDTALSTRTAVGHTAASPPTSGSMITFPGRSRISWTQMR